MRGEEGLKDGLSTPFQVNFIHFILKHLSFHQREACVYVFVHGLF